MKVYFNLNFMHRRFNPAVHIPPAKFSLDKKTPAVLDSIDRLHET